MIDYWRGARQFVRVRPNRQGRSQLESVRLLLGLREGRVVCWSADGGEEIVNLTAIAQACEAEAQARQAAEAALAEAQARIRALEAQPRRNGSQQ